MEEYEHIEETADDFEESEEEFERIKNSKDKKDIPAAERIKKFLNSVYEACRKANLTASSKGLGGYDFCEVNLAADVKEIFELIVMNYIHDRGYEDDGYPLCSTEAFLKSWINTVIFIRTLCDAEKEAYMEFIRENPFAELKYKLRSDIKTNKHLAKALQSSLKNVFLNMMDSFYDGREFENDEVRIITAEEFKESFRESLSEFIIFK